MSTDKDMQEIEELVRDLSVTRFLEGLSRGAANSEIVPPLPYPSEPMHKELLARIRQMLEDKPSVQAPVWCGCGDGIMPDTGARCGTCAMVDDLTTHPPAQAPQQGRVPLTREQVEAVREWFIEKHACWFTAASLNEMFQVAGIVSQGAQAQESRNV